MEQTVVDVKDLSRSFGGKIALDGVSFRQDNETQAQVTKSLERLQATRVVVAHRLSTIENADKIIVLERGRVVQVGTYQELMEVEGVFKDIARRQTT